MVVTEVEDNVFNAHTVIGLDTSDRCYQLHGRPSHTAHLAQSSDHSASLSPVSGSSSTPQGVILTVGEYEEYLRLTQAAKSSSIAYVAQTGNVCLPYTFIFTLDP